MVFSSLTFLFFFFPLTLILCFAGKKIRWRNGELQPAKIYVLGNANLLSDETERKAEAPTAPSRK